MSASIEIRVHVSGPSRGSDDARYRREAQGFLSFQSSQRINIIDKDDVEEPRGTDSSSPFFNKIYSNPDETVTTSDSLGPTQRTGAIRELFNSRLQSETPRGTPVRYTALRTPAATKLASPVLPWTSIKETPHLLVKGTPFPPRPQTAPGTPSRATRVLTRSQSDSWETPPSVIPDSQERRPYTQPQVLNSPILKRQLPPSSVSEELEPSPTRKRVRHRSPSPLQAESLQSQIELLQTQEIGPAATSLSQDGGNFKVTQGSNRQKAIWPKRGPEVGNHKFETHLTSRLVKLASDPNIESLNIKCPTTRPVGCMERGYWRVDIALWSESNKEKVWLVLEDFISRGKAGWGVWCARGIDSQNAYDKGRGKNWTTEHEDLLKVWCFGEVIREVFLILYIGGVNKKKNPETKAEWIDGNGDVVATATGKYLG